MVKHDATAKEKCASLDMPRHAASESDLLDDDGRKKRTGSVWTASAHIITAVIGSGVLSLAWAIAQLGWILGPFMMLLFSFFTYYTSILLSACYRNNDPINGKRNYTYMDAIQSNLGGFQVMLCGLVQYINLWGVAVGYTIASAVSLEEMYKSMCSHKSVGEDPCKEVNTNMYIIAFGIAQIFLCQIPNIDELWWLSYVAAIMSFTYSTIGVGLGLSKAIENGSIAGSLTGISVGTVTVADKVWRSFQAIGNIAFAYSYSMILIEIQDTIKSPPSEEKTMNKATLISVIVTTIFYMLCGGFGYAAFGDASPGNLLAGYGSFNPFGLLDIANATIVIHLLGAYQVYSQPIFYVVEKEAARRFPNCPFVTKDIKVGIPGVWCFNLNLFRMVWRTAFAVVSTVVAMALPFFNDVVGLLGALGFWPLTVYFPVEMYMVQRKVAKWSSEWMWLQALSLVCLIITIAAAVGSIVGIVNSLQNYKVFSFS
ncbi:amino acid permease 3-like [Senna tora]|uniref:Amino acid permease 3-like n=1 Tax=Senna tora TaxID=362788 RepID=A0A834WRQ3_9FABA|nr:amino acid permease 3-like [Senna tora]